MNLKNPKNAVFLFALTTLFLIPLAASATGIDVGGGFGCRQFGSSSPDPVALRRIILAAAFLVFVIVLVWKGSRKGKPRRLKVRKPKSKNKR